MMDQPTLSAHRRTSSGSGQARKVRRTGQIPGILYGRGEEVPISIPLQDFRGIVRPEHYGSAIIRLQLDDQDEGVVLVKAVQIFPLKHQLLSVDLQRVSMEEYLPVTVPVEIVGEPADRRIGGTLEQMSHAVNLRCRASAIPSRITVDVSQMTIGNVLHAGELPLPLECELLDKADDVIVLVAPPTVRPEEEPVVVEEIAGPDLTGMGQQSDVPAE